MAEDKGIGLYETPLISPPSVILSRIVSETYF